jgi:hypothetical protein
LVDADSTRALRESRDRTRLAQLLLSRGHAASALMELDELSRASSSFPSGMRAVVSSDPMQRWVRARALEPKDGLLFEGKPLFEDPRSVAAPFAPWWASRGRWMRSQGDADAARESFAEGLAADPFEPEAACEASEGEPAASGVDRTLCLAARAWRPSPFDD